MTTDDTSSMSNTKIKDLVASLYSCEKNPFSASKYGAPMSNKAETRAVLNEVLEGIRPASSNVAGLGPLLLSDIPKSAKESEEVVMGVDEAGRGSVLGPMVSVHNHCLFVSCVFSFLKEEFFMTIVYHHVYFH